MDGPMRILVACEESQAVTIELRRLGHEAYSCDIQPCSGGFPEWHLQADALELLKMPWDMIIAFPPCTYLTNACNRAYSLRCTPEEKVLLRLQKREKAAAFFLKFANADCAKIAIENPLGYMNSHYRAADQIVHPFYFAESEQDEANYHKKRTCLWLKGLPCLERTSYLPPPPPKYICQGLLSKGKAINGSEGMSGIKGGREERAKARSKTFPGIARAMAEQWAGRCCL